MPWTGEAPGDLPMAAKEQMKWTLVARRIAALIVSKERPGRGRMAPSLRDLALLKALLRRQSSGPHGGQDVNLACRRLWLPSYMKRPGQLLIPPTQIHISAQSPSSSTHSRNSSSS
ncbi:hypothetical protein G6O67_007954 [Ophiocordyceps sinensis]|uniref:Uncharacterized protein n=1 Tax=Ophiocordyceps sinensis TaxID=72228 RepID=A0A8H4LSB8_9HYPO|nr:hypothetical protein G6O67_007954 [Ophiocordyceps sinensis]